MKIMRFLYILTILVFFSISSCKTKRQEVVEYNISLKGNNVRSLTEIVDIEEFIPLETHPDAIMNSIWRIYVTKNSDFLIFDRKGKQILLFSTKGKFIRSIGRKGNGPNEYADPLDIAYNREKNEIYVLGNQKIMVFNTEGEYLKKIKLDFFGRSIFYFKNYLLVHRAGMYSDGVNYSLLKIDMKGKIVDNLLPLIPTKGDFVFSVGKNFTGTDIGVKYIRSFDYTVYLYDGKELNPCVTFDFGKNNTSKDAILKCNSYQEFKKIINNPDRIHSINSIIEIGNYMYVRVVLNNKAYSIYINKNTGEILKYLHKNLHDLFVQVSPIDAHDDYLINIFYPYFKSSPGVNYPFRLKYSKDNTDEKLFHEFTNLLSMDIKENPVIIITKPKF